MLGSSASVLDVFICEMGTGHVPDAYNIGFCRNLFPHFESVLFCKILSRFVVCENSYFLVMSEPFMDL